MNWANYLENFQDTIVSKPTSLPYFLLFVGLFFTISCGLAFAASLTGEMDFWYRNPSTLHLARFERLKLLFPFVGGFLGFWIFLAASLEMFGLSVLISWVGGFLVSGVTGLFTWSLLGKSIGQGVVHSYLDAAMHPEHR